MRLRNRTIPHRPFTLTTCSSVCSVREREENLHLAATNKLIHGGPRVHDGKYRHWSHVLLWGGYVQSCTPDLALESRTPADPVDHPCSALGRLRSLRLLCRTLQWSRRITPINSIHPLQWRPIISYVEILASRQHDHFGRNERSSWLRSPERRLDPSSCKRKWQK